MIRTLSLLAAALALSSCSGQIEEDKVAAVEATPTAEAARRTLAGRDYDPYLAIRGLDPQWSELPIDSRSNYSPSLGLDRSNFSWRNTSLVYDRTDEGGVYMIQVRSGLPGRCTAGPDLSQAFDRFAEDFALKSQALEVRPQLLKAWTSSDGQAEVELGDIMVRAIGGCPRALVIKAL